MQVNRTYVTTPKPASEAKVFVFSTDDFASCFKSSTRADSNPFINVTHHNHGVFTFVGRDYVRTGSGRCYITITVPAGLVLLFEMLDFTLPCSKASARIYNDTDIRGIPKFPTICEQERPRKRFNVHFNIATVAFDVKQFSPVLVMNLRFSAVSHEGPQLQHKVINTNKGMSFTSTLF